MLGCLVRLVLLLLLLLLVTGALACGSMCLV
jgi:hypothetical protein